jgi:multicomponent Na+:H+ antiporter subunit A
MQEAIFLSFGLALVAPWLHRLTRSMTGWLLGLAIAGIAAHLARFAPRIAAGETLPESRPWFPGLDVQLSFHLDALSLIFGLLITAIGALVVIYAGGYASQHKHLGRMYAFLIAFMGSMLGVVFADNVVTLFVFWELTSLASFFLIGIDHDKPRARYAALQALLVTGAGGLALLAGFILLGMIGGSYDISALADQRTTITEHRLYLPMLLLILAGAFTKSAQVPFQFWLPNAMEAPTPISAYLHSATMVKAGVYLLARLTPVMGSTDAWYILVTGFGAVTFAVGAAMALAQTDLKRLLAYSTVATLGTLIMLIGIGTPSAIEAMLLLLVAHALYKATLFLTSGAVDHEAGTRDIEKLGGLARAMPVTAAAALIAAISFAGIPPLAGFLAKEGLYQAAKGAPASAVVLTIVALVSNMALVAVAAMAGWKPFLGRGARSVEHVHEAPMSMWLGPVLMTLAGLAIGVKHGWFDTIAAAGVTAITGEHAEVHLALWHGFNVVLVLSAVTLAGGVAVYLKRGRLLDRVKPLQSLTRWGPDRAYDLGLSGTLRVAAVQTRYLQSGYLRYYLTTIVMALVIGVGLILALDASSLSTIGWTSIRFHECIPPLLILCATIMALVTISRLAAVVALGIVGVGVTLIYVFFSAPDLAMTQVAVETLTVILFVLVLYRLPRFARFTTTVDRVRDVVVASLVGLVMTVLILVLTAEAPDSQISRYFAEQSYPEGKGRNIVNVILVDFRGLDTLGEITVLSIAALGIFGLMKLVIPEKKEGRS